MIFRITLKDPDGVWTSLEEAFGDPNELPEDDKRAIEEFVEYGEYVQIEIDTKKGTAVVVPV